MRFLLASIIFLSCLCIALPSISATMDSFKTRRVTSAERDRRAPAQVSCGETPDKVTTQISIAKSCTEAENIAQQCAWGGSTDTAIVERAIEVCAKEYTKSMTVDDKNLLGRLTERCVKKYEERAGSIYDSMKVFCKLQVSVLFSEFYSQLE